MRPLRLLVLLLTRLFVSMVQGLGLEMGRFASGSGTLQGMELRG